MLRVPVVLSFHGLDIAELKRSTGVARSLWRAILKSADHLVVVSEAMKQELVQTFPGLRTAVIHNGVSAGIFSELAEDPAAVPTILNIGKFEHKKAQDVLLRAFRRLLDRGVQARLLLVGATGPKLAETQYLISRLGMEEYVSMHVDVPHDRVPALFKQSNLFVLPSRSEPFGLVLLEAGASGVPIIATSVGGIPEVVQHNVTGLLIPPDDEIALEEALERLLRDEQLRTRLSKCMREDVLKRWDWGVAGNEYCRLVEAL